MKTKTRTRTKTNFRALRADYARNYRKTTKSQESGDLWEEIARMHGRCPTVSNKFCESEEGTVTKLELSRRVAFRLGGNDSLAKIKEIQETVDLLIDEIIAALSKTKRIEIRGFGVFKTKIRRPRFGRNPRTGQQVQIHERRVPSFRFSKGALAAFRKKESK